MSRADRLRARLTLDLPEAVTPWVLVLAMFAIVMTGLTDSDVWMNAAGACLLLDALFLRVEQGLRRRN